MKNFFKSVFATVVGMIVGSILLLFVLPAVIFSVSKVVQVSSEPIEEKSVLHLHLNGEIVDKARPLDFNFLSPTPFSLDEQSQGLFELTKALKAAKTDARIKGLYLRIGDVQAGWASIESLRKAIVDFGASGKFIVAYAESMDEKMLYLASAAQEVYLQPNGDIEFNGLVLSSAFVKGLLQKLEVEPRIFRVGKFKAAVEPLLLEKMSDANRLQSQALIDDIWTDVRGTLSRTEKKIKAEDLDRLSAGLEVSSADEAVNAGLINKALFEDEVLKLLSERTVGKDEEARLATPGQLLHETKLKSITHKSKIAVIFAEGEISNGVGDRGTIGSDAFVESLKEAKEDEDVKAIVVRINSPGGDALASDVMWREMRVTDQEIPVIASMGDVAASGGYYMAAGARHIFAEPGTITGSIGVFGVLMDSEKFFGNKLGVRFDRVVTHPYADIGNSNRPMAEIEKQKIQSDVERVYSRFVGIVKESRHLPEDFDPADFAEGRVWSGKRAAELKLVDEIGGLDEAIGKAAQVAELGQAYDLDVYPRDRQPLEQLLELVSGETAKMFLRSEPAKQMKSIVNSLPALKSGVYARMPFDLRIR